jgi:CHAT domain-containing protein/tetratricopeptide (TPR) repeat protein
MEGGFMVTIPCCGVLGVIRRLVLPILVVLPLSAGVQAQHDDFKQQDKRARALADAGKFSQAITLTEDLVRKAEARFGANDPNVVNTLCFLGYLYNRDNRFTEGERVFQRCVALMEKLHGPRHPLLARNLMNLANSYKGLNRHDDAEATYKRALILLEKALGPQHPDLAKALCNVADLLKDRGRYAEVELLARRCVAILEQNLGPKHVDLPQGLKILAGSLQAQGKYAIAEPLLKRSLEISEKSSGPEHPILARSLDGLANLYVELDRLDEAETLYLRSLALDESIYGPDHPYIGGTLNNLANIYSRTGRAVQAEQVQKRALAIFEKTLGDRHPKVASLLNNWGLSYIKQKRWVEAYDALRRAAAIQQAAAIAPAQSSRSLWADVSTERRSLSNLAIAAWGLAREQSQRRPELARETFEAAQVSDQQSAGAALSQLSVRFASGDSAIGNRIREQQDLQRQRQRVDAALMGAISEPVQRRNQATIDEQRRNLAVLEKKLTDLTTLIEDSVPAYRALATPTPLSVAEVQDLLRGDEALIRFLARSSDETFVWVVTRSSLDWTRLPIGQGALAREVTALRCGLDSTAWTGPACRELTGVDYTDADRNAGKPLPFDHGRAHRLYVTLFGEHADRIEGKHLLLVPSGALTALPFQVLVAQPPKGGNDATIQWLIRSHALTVLPAVASLKALRSNAQTSKAPEPFIGFGDPVLTGHPACGVAVVPDACPGDKSEMAAAKVSARNGGAGAAMAEASTYFRNGFANVAALDRLCPLPDTAHELRCVARSLGAKPNSLNLGKDMTESRLKSTTLDRYRVIHFATHGLLAGETAMMSKALAEPALVMTPPKVPTAEDDGLLTASEIASLKLDADWVVMSACNTAGGGEEGAEALSGLARAFFYAGARALLVSHWPVDSYAATMLTSQTFATMNADRGIGRSEAFRRAMLALMSDTARPWAAHPSVWAPFVVVGEGATMAK